MRLRKPLFIAALSAVVVAAAYAGFWYYARGVALNGIADWVEAQRDAGFRIAHEPLRTGGFPFVVQINADAVSAADAGGRWSWRAGGIGVEIRPWDFRRVRIEAFGKQNFTFRRDGAVTRIALEARESVAIIAKSGRLGDLTLRIQKPRLSGDAGELRAGEIWLEAAMAATPPTTHNEPLLRLSLAAADAVLPAAWGSALGRKIKTLRADIKVLGAIAGGPLGDAIEAWRQNGGTVEVEWLHLVWGPADLRAKGTLALDAQQRLLGALSADIRGHDAALEALRAASMVSDMTASLAKIGLALLARTPAEGGAPVLSLPVTAQGGALYLGPVKLLNLPKILFLVRSR